jgi:RNA polymerase sigma-70 factor (ECF subfamily)
MLLSLHAVRATYDPERPFMPWLLAIARNRLADSARRYSRQAAYEVQVGTLPVTFPDDATNLDDKEFAAPELLRQAMSALPQAQRLAIEMLKVREMSLKEASAATGMSIGALKVSSHRGMGALRVALKPD